MVLHHPTHEPGDSGRVRSAILGRAHSLARHLDRALIVAGCSCLAWVGWAWLDAASFQRQAASAVIPLPEVEVEVEEGTVVGRLWIPRVGIGVAIAEGVSEGVLRRTVGHVPGTALPGSPGNVVLAGHRDTFFRSLESIRAGDAIYIENGAGVDIYLVDWFRVVAPSEVALLGSTPEPALTLVTCYPFRFVGSAPSRFVVRARHASGPAAEEQHGAAVASMTWDGR